MHRRITDVGITSNVEKSKENKKKGRNIILLNLNDYIVSSNLHGLRYIGETNKRLPEKIWWGLMCILSVVICSYLINNTWIKWKNNPVILSFEKEQTQIWKIPFPAVTICPMNKIELFTDFNYTRSFLNRKNLTGGEYKMFWDVSLVCNLEQYDFMLNEKCNLNITDKAGIEFLRRVTVSLHKSGDAKWQNKDLPLPFAEQLTEEGLCFTFNSLSQQDMFTVELDQETNLIMHNISNEGWNVEDGYPPDISWNTYPRRTAQPGHKSGLSLRFSSMNTRTDYICGFPMHGFKLTFHSPAETANVAQQYLLVPLDKMVSVIVRPELTTNSMNVRYLPPHTRNCYFSNERYLRFFKVYTQNNCRFECNANVTQQYCGCVPFYLPRDRKMAICGHGRKSCIREVESITLNLEVTKTTSDPSIEDKDKLRDTRKIFSKCDCLPACTKLHYNTKSSQTDSHWTKTVMATGLFESKVPPADNERIQAILTITQIDIYFKESQFLSMHRSELFSQTDFLGTCGGLLGLFMGFSILSLFEIVYFLTIRMWCIYRARRQNKM